MPFVPITLRRALPLRHLRNTEVKQQVSMAVPTADPGQAQPKSLADILDGNDPLEGQNEIEEDNPDEIEAEEVETQAKEGYCVECEGEFALMVRVVSPRADFVGQNFRSACLLLLRTVHRPLL